MRLSAKTLSQRVTWIPVGNNGRMIFDHRGQAIRMACDLEVALTDAAVAWFSAVSTSQDLVNLRKALFEDGSINSLRKLSEFAYFAGLIGPKTKHDLKRFASMRDRYAHDRARDNLDRDPEMFAILQSMHLYRDNFDLLHSVSQWEVLVRVFWQLFECISDGYVE